jgi:hypothetical protein
MGILKVKNCVYVLQRIGNISDQSNPLHNKSERQPIEILGAFRSYKKAYNALFAFKRYEDDEIWILTSDYVSFKLTEKDNHPPKKQFMFEDNSYVFMEMEHQVHGISTPTNDWFKIQIFEDV